MDKTSENVSLPEGKPNEDENLPSTSSIIKNDDSPALGDTGILPLPTEESIKSNNESKVEPKTQQQTLEGESLAISDSQREKNNKTPEELIEEVEGEVNKLNISEPEAFVDKMNESLKNVLAYNSDSSDSDDSEGESNQNCESKKNEKPMKQKTIVDSSSSSSDSQTDSFSEDSKAEPENKKSKTKLIEKSNRNEDSDTSDSESDSAGTLSSDSDREDSRIIFSDAETDCDSVIDNNEDENIKLVNKSNNKGAVKKTNITGFEEADCIPIPDISNLNINEEVEFMHIGSITYIIAEIATVTVIPGTPAFDLDSMLFIEHENVKKPMGPIFDVIGPVSNPIYCVRFNSEEEIRKVGLKSGTKVFAAPKSEEFTKFVFLAELLKMKHSDASYRNDTEVPVNMAEFSDDEKEREARRRKVGGKRKINDNSLERHKTYEQNMNQTNTMHTKLSKMADIRKKQFAARNKGGTPQFTQLNNPSIPVEFDPTVPPPGFERTVAAHQMDYHYSMAAMFQQQQSMYAAYQASAHAMQNTANPYQLNFANAFAPPPSDYNPSQNQQPPTVNSYLFQNFTSNSRNNRGPGPSSQPY